MKLFVFDELSISFSGITCPIIPGIMPIQSYDSLRYKDEFPYQPKNIFEPMK